MIHGNRVHCSKWCGSGSKACEGACGVAVMAPKRATAKARRARLQQMQVANARQQERRKAAQGLNALIKDLDVNVPPLVVKESMMRQHSRRSYALWRDVVRKLLRKSGCEQHW